MTKSLLSASRIWHRRVSSILFVFFLVVSLTGLMLGWKSLFSTTVYALSKNAKNPKHGKDHQEQHWLPLDTLEIAAAGALTEHTGRNTGHAERADIRLPGGYIEFLFDHSYYVRVEGGTGTVTGIERRYGGWIQDIHDGAIIDSWLGDKAGAVKKFYSTVIGAALLFLTGSGIYLWYKPLLIKKATRRS